MKMPLRPHFSSVAVAETVVCALVIGTLLYRYFRKRRVPDSGLVDRSSRESSVNRELYPRGLIGEMRRQDKTVVVFYGSQTGTAKEFAIRLGMEAARYGLGAMVVDPEDCKMEELTQLTSIPNHLALFCIATQGEGEPTDNCHEFHQWLQETTANLSDVNYAVFGLGDKTYEHYNSMGRYVARRLRELGAKQIFPLGEGDDDGNIEDDFITWKDALWASICGTFGIEQSRIDTSMRHYELIVHEENSLPADRVFTGEMSQLTKFNSQTPPYCAKRPYYAEVVEKRELYKGDRSCLHVEFNIQNSRMRYDSGDHVGVYPQNDANIVDRIGELLDTDLDQVITLKNTDQYSAHRHPFPCPCSYRTALTHYVDICAPPRTHILSELAGFCIDNQDGEKLKLMSSNTPEGKLEYETWILKDCRSIVQILEELPSCKPPLDLLLEFLPRLQPRFFSISSSFTVHPGRIHITAVTVDHSAPTGRRVWGVATGQLSRIPIGTKLPIFVRRSRFRLPTRPVKPIIMVGPGTGVAPFRGFLQERHYQRTVKNREVGESHLFFGCRKSDEDFLYREELEAFVANGTCKLYTAFSRDQDEKVYVTHLLKERKDLIWRIIGEQEGHIYVCGDVRSMAREVQDIIMTTLQEKGNMSYDNAKNYFKTMESQRRYSTDVWS